MTLPNSKLACLLAAGLAAALPLAAQAQAAADDWKFGATVYGWFPAIGGTSSFPTGGSGSSVDVSAKQVIDALKFAFMGTFEAKKGPYGFWTDLVYADFSGSKSGSRDLSLGHVGLPAGVSADLNLDVKSTIWTLAGTYSLVDKPEYALDALAGARMLDMKQTLGWNFNGIIAGLPLPGRAGSAELNVRDWDAVIGVKGRAMFGEERKWFIPYYLDIGTGQSKFTWQAIGGVGYQFNKWGSVLATWRYLSYDLKSGSPIDTVYLNGPAIGVNFRW